MLFLHLSHRWCLQNFGRDLFLIDGDALLAYVLSELSPTTVGSFQLLPVVFRYEQVLSRFNELGAQFRLFFLGMYENWGWKGWCCFLCCTCIFFKSLVGSGVADWRLERVYKAMNTI